MKPPRTLRVLIVEDSEDDATLLVRELKKGGFEPEYERVETPEAMRSALDDSGWDVILADWRMPRFSALRAMEMARATCPRTPFIIVSGEVGEEAAVEAMRSGATDYVMKDNLVRLCATVERGLEEAEARRERERAEKSLRESERRFRSLVMNSSDMITVFAPDGTRLYSSPSTERLLGYDPEAMISGSAFDIVHPDDAGRVREEFAELSRNPGTGRPFEFRLRHADGSWRVFESIGSNLIGDPGVGGLVFNARDVTDRKKMEERYRSLVELSPDAVIVHDGEMFLFVNAACADLLGAASPEEVVGERVMDFIHPNHREAAMARVSRPWREGERTELVREKFLRLDGRAVDVEVSAMPISYGDGTATLAVARDITERERIEGELRGREAILRAVASASEMFLERMGSWEESAHEVLERLGEATGVSRVYIYEVLFDSEGGASPTKRYEWLAEGVEAGIDNIAELGPPADYSRWGEILSSGRPVCGHAREFPEVERPAFEADGTLSIALVPVFVEGKLWGFIGFDECEREREWPSAEMGALEAAADTLGAAIQRERAEEAIRQSEQLYRAVVEQATEYIFLTDVETRRIVGSNPAFREALGYTEEELESMTLYDIVAHDRDSVDENARRVLESGRHSLGERRHRRKDGSLIDVEVSASMVLHGGREVACIVGHDVTERRRKEEELRESEERFRGTFEQAAVGVAHVSPHGSWLRVNQKLCEIAGYSREELLERTFQDITHPDDLEADLGQQERLLSGGIPGYSMEKRYLRKDGSVVWIQLTTSLERPPSEEPKYFIAIVEDITDRKQAMDALSQSEERYRAVVEQAAEGIFLFDAATGEVLESNTAFQEMLGYAAAETSGMTLNDIVAHDRESIDRNVRLVRNEGSRFVGERKYRRKDGSVVEVEVTASLISYGGRAAICVVVRDITDRLEAFRMLEERVTTLAGIAASLSVDRPVKTTLNALASGIVEGTEAVACSVVLIDPETAMIRLAGSSGLPEGYTDTMQASWRGGVHSRMVRVFRSRQPSLGHDVRRIILDNPLYSPIHPLVRDVRWDTVYIVPLVARGESLGALNLYYLPGHEPTGDEKVFLTAVADQTAVAVENARLFAAAQGRAALEERQRLARELHDSVSQALYGIGLGARTARTLLEREAPSERVDEWLEYVRSLAEAGLTEMRALIFELRPESLESEGLVVALQKQAAAVAARHEIPVRATLGEEPDLALEAKEALYRIAQEAMHNTVKHARASGVDLDLARDETTVTLEISDDGAGFDPSESFSGRLGLRSMRERAERLGGTLEIQSAVGEGATVRVIIPSAP